jgi:hypothetical protein
MDPTPRPKPSPKPLKPFWLRVADYASRVQLPADVAELYSGHERLTFTARFFLALHLLVDGQPWSVTVRVLSQLMGCAPCVAGKLIKRLERDAVIASPGKWTHKVRQFVYVGDVPENQPAPPSEPIEDGPVPWTRGRPDYLDVFSRN